MTWHTTATIALICSIFVPFASLACALAVEPRDEEATPWLRGTALATTVVATAVSVFALRLWSTQ